jgi:hypothetical protein
MDTTLSNEAAVAGVTVLETREDSPTSTMPTGSVWPTTTSPWPMPWLWLTP